MEVFELILFTYTNYTYAKIIFIAYSLPLHILYNQGNCFRNTVKHYRKH